MSKRLMSLVIIVGMVMSLLLVGCSGGGKEVSEPVQPNQEESELDESTTPTDEGSGILREATGSKIGSLNPHTYTSTYQSTVINRTQAKLYAYLPNDDFTSYELKGELAESAPEMMDEDGKVWRMKLKEGLTWANGDTLNADDVMYTWKALLDPKMVQPRGGSFAKDYISILNATEYYLQNSEDGVEIPWEDVGLKKIDELTLEVTTVEKQSVDEVMNHFAHTANAIVYDVYYEKFMNEDRTETLYGTDLDKFMASGKFIIENWIPDSLVVYKKNPKYLYKDYIWLEGIETKVVEDKGTQMQLFEKDQIDYVQLSSEDYLRYEQDPRVLSHPKNSVTHLTFNTINPEKTILANINLRKAIYYAIDRESIAKLTKDTPANYLVSTRQVIDPITGLRYRTTDLAKANLTPNLGFDSDLAKEYFEKALEEEGLEKVELKITYSDSEFYKVITEYLQKNVPSILGEDKISFKLQAMPSKQLTALRKTFNENPTCYEISWSAWSGNELAPWNAMKYWTGSYGRKNEPFYNDEFDKIWQEANYGESRFEQGKKLEYTAKMEEILLREMPLVPVVQGSKYYIKNARVKLVFPEWINKISFGWEYAKIAE